MFRFFRILSICVFFFLSSLTFGLQSPQTAETVTAGTLLHVQVESDAKMKPGASVRARLIEPVFVNNRTVIPAGSRIMGKVIEVSPASSSKRNAARLQGDFTPLHQAHIQFNQAILPDGGQLAIASKPASDGLQMVHIESLGAALHRPSLPKRLWSEMIGREKTTVNTFTAPGKISRLKKYFYHQIPYHPETVETGLEYDVELTGPLQVSLSDAIPTDAGQKTKPGLQDSAVIHALLENDLSSKDAQRGTPIRAVVTQPLFDRHGWLAVPQGTILAGSVTEARPAGKHGQSGILRFAFRQMNFPAGFQQNIHGAAKAVNADGQANLQMDAEGGVTAQKPSLITPLITGLLATSALGEDENTVMHSGVAGNGFALIGRLVAIGSGSRYVAGSIGLFSTARSVYARFIGHGSDVSFPRNTRIEIAVDPVTSPTLQPE